MYQLVTKAPGRLPELIARAQTGSIIELGEHENESWIINPKTNLPILFLRSEGISIKLLNEKGEEISLGQYKGITPHNCQFDFHNNSLVIGSDAKENNPGDFIRVLFDGKEIQLGKRYFDESWTIDHQGRIFFEHDNEYFFLDNNNFLNPLCGHQVNELIKDWGVGHDGQLIIVTHQDNTPWRERKHTFIKVNLDIKEVVLGQYLCSDWEYSKNSIVLGHSENESFSRLSYDGKKTDLGQHHHHDWKCIDDDRIFFRKNEDFFVLTNDGKETFLGSCHLCRDRHHDHHWEVGPLGIIIENQQNFSLMVIK